MHCGGPRHACGVGAAEGVGEAMVSETSYAQPTGTLRGRFGATRFFQVDSLAAAFDPRNNSLAVMRLTLAALVAVAHGFYTGFGHQPGLRGGNLSDFAVDAFFVLSGFLVARSFLTLRSVRRYAWHRFLRIMPGFWGCLVVTAVLVAPLAALLADRSAFSVFLADEDPAWQYALVNAALPIVQFDIAGIGVPSGETAFNGSLWTLQYEALAYAALAGLGVLGLLRRRGMVLALTGLAWAMVGVQAAGLIPFDVPVLENTSLLRFMLMFLLGVCGHLYADRLPMGAAWAVLAAVTTVASMLVLPDYRWTGAFGFAYLCLYGMVRLPVRITPAWDLSYGLYIYHWPLQILLALAGATALGEWSFVVLSLVVALVAAALSWRLVERPALEHKGAQWVERKPPVGSWRPQARSSAGHSVR